MAELFLKIFNMSSSACWLILSVILLRLIFRRMPKWGNCILWAAVAVRLACPFTVESALSLVPSAEPLPQKVISGPSFKVNTGVQLVDRPVNEYLGDHYFEGVSVPARAGFNAMTAWAAVWLVGVLAMFIYGIASYIRIYRRVGASLYMGDRVWVCDGIQMPFILGVIRPRIYLPSALPEGQTEHVLAHENAHLKRRDHWWKPLGFILLSVYWFNPLCWAAYVLFVRDIELACDERVVRDMDMECRKAYSEALLSCSMPQRIISACPLAFGEVGVRERIKSVLHYKKPAFWVVAAAVLLCAVTAVCFLTNPKEKEQEENAQVGSAQEDTAGQKAEGSTEEEQFPKTEKQDATENIQSGRYRLLPITQASVQNEFFSMEVPQEMVTKVSCVLDVQPDGLNAVYFFLDSLAEGYTVAPYADELYGFTESGIGLLGSIFWEDFTDYEERGILEELMLRSGSAKISGMNYCYNRLFDAGQWVVAVNDAETGAYFIRLPDNVQFAEEAAEEYGECQVALTESVSSFAPKAWPMEETHEQLYKEGKVTAVYSHGEYYGGLDALWHFKQAEKLYSLFSGYSELSSRPEYGSYEAASGDTVIRYEKADSEDFQSMGDLERILKFYFTEPMVEKLLEKKVPGTDLPLFVERDGELYVAKGYVGEYAYDDYEAQYLTLEDEDADGNKTATVSMLCRADIWGEERVEELEYTLVGTEETALWSSTMPQQTYISWKVTDDFVLPIERLMTSGCR